MNKSITASKISRFRRYVRETLAAMYQADLIAGEITASHTTGDFQNYFKIEDLESPGSYIDDPDLPVSQAEYEAAVTSVAALRTFLEDNFHTTNLFKVAP